MSHELVISIEDNHVILKDPGRWKQLRELVEQYLEGSSETERSATGKDLDKVEELLKRDGAAKITDLERRLPGNVSRISLAGKMKGDPRFSSKSDGQYKLWFLKGQEGTKKSTEEEEQKEEQEGEQEEAIYGDSEDVDKFLQKRKEELLNQRRVEGVDANIEV